MADRNLEIALRIKADLESARKQLDDLNKSVKATGDNSKASNDLLEQASQHIGAMEQEAAGLNSTLGNTGKALGTTATKTTALDREVATLAKHLVTGNFDKAGESIANIGTSSELAEVGLGGLALGITAGVAVLALLVKAAIDGAREEDELNRMIIATGNYAGVTAPQVRGMADEIDQVTGVAGPAGEALKLLLTSGQVTGASLQQAAQLAVDLSTVTGQSIDKSVAAVVRLQEDPVRAIQTLDSAYHLLTLTQYEQIKALADEGDAEGAARLAQDDAAAALRSRALDVEANVGLMQRAWQNLRGNVIATWDAMKGIGRPGSNTDDLADINKQLDAFRSRVAEIRARQGDTTPITDQALASAGEVALSHDKIVELLSQKQAASAGANWEKWVADTQGQNQQVQTVAKQASDVMSGYLKSAKSDEAKAAEVASVKEATQKLITTNPANADKYRADEQTALAYLDKKYAPPKTPQGRDTNAATDRAAAAAQQQLIDMLAGVQGKLDPTAAAWATYNQEVDKATKTAATAAKGTGANVTAINAERDAYIAAAAQVRDAAIAKIAAQDQQAWEKLRDSLRTPTEVKIDTAAAQIAELNRLIAAGVDIGGKYQATLNAIVTNSIVAAPKYQGVDAAVSGPAGELIKAVQAGQALETWHAAQLASNEAFRQKDIANEAAANARMLQIDKQYAAQKAAIDDAKAKLSIDTAVAGFGALAGAAKNAYGEQSKQYRVAFALQKAAALAQAILAIQTSIAESSKVGFPWNIVTIAGAVAQGVAVLATINSTSLGGYATGGEIREGGPIRGPGTGTSDSVLLRGSNGEFMQREAAVKYYGVDFMHAVNNLDYPRYATGGLIGMDAPAPPSLPSIASPTLTPSSGNGAMPQINQRIVVGLDSSLLDDWSTSSSFEKAVKVVVGRNPSFIRQTVQR